VLGAGQAVELKAACTDLFSDPPTAATQFTGGSGSQVELADGRVMGLDQAMQAGVLSLTGTPTTFNPLRRGGSLLLQLSLRNLSGVPVAVRVRPGTQVTPEGQGAQPLPAGGERVFSLAQERGLADSNTLQHAVWAARGNSAEDVEQTQMTRLDEKEVARVQQLLEDAGIRQQFERPRGEYARRYEDALDALGSAARSVRGTAYLGDGSKAEIEGARAADGEGVVTVRPLKRGGEFRYRAQFADRKDGRISVKLFHLKTGRPLVAQRSVLLYPAG